MIGSSSSSLGIAISFPAISLVLVALRFYNRHLREVGYGPDDWLVIPAWLASVGSCATIIYGFDNHAFSENKQAIIARAFGALAILWLIANCCIKLSMLFLYRRIIVGSAFNVWSWIIVALTAIWAVYGFLAWLLFCGKHVHANFEGGWDVCPAWGVRLQIGVYLWDCILDVGLIILPIPFVWKLQVTAKKRLAIIGTFVVGCFAFIAGVNNAVLQLDYIVNYNLFTTGDSTLEGAPGNTLSGPDLLFFNWQTLEVGVGLIACNLPVLGSFFFTQSNRALRTLRQNSTFSRSRSRSESRSKSRQRRLSLPLHVSRAESQKSMEEEEVQPHIHSRESHASDISAIPLSALNFC